MPLTPGKSKATFSKNISEFHKGPTFAATSKKFGKARANKQAVAVAYSEAKRTGKGQDMPYTAVKRQVGSGHGTCPKCKSKTIGKGHDCSASMKKVGKGQDVVRDDYERDPTSTDSLTMTRKVAPKPEQPKPFEPLVGSGQGKRVGKGQGPPSAGGGMPPRKPKGAMPLPGAKGSRRHRPPMNKRPPGGGLGGPMDALKPPMPPMGGMPGPGGPGGMPPMGGGAPMGPAMLPGAGAGGTPGMPPPRPMGMGQARKKSAKKKAPAKGKK